MESQSPEVTQLKQHVATTFYPRALPDAAVKQLQNNLSENLPAESKPNPESMERLVQAAKNENESDVDEAIAILNQLTAPKAKGPAL